MAETPASKPGDAQLRTWGDGVINSREEPTSGLVSSGYADEAILPHDEFNWLVQYLGALAEIAVRGAVRTFDQLDEAIAATVPGELFQLTDGPQGHFATQSVSRITGGGGTPRALATDGLRLYNVTTTGAVTGAPASPGLGSTWSATPGIDHTRALLSADGQILAVGEYPNATNEGLTVLDAQTGAQIFRTMDFPKPVGAVALVADSNATLQRVWLTDFGLLWRWDSINGLKNLNGVGDDIYALCVTRDHVWCLVNESGTMRLYRHDKTSNDFSAAPVYAAFAYNAIHAKMVTDGDDIYVLVDDGGGACNLYRIPVGFSTPPVSTSFGLLASIPHISANLALGLEVDDRYVYVKVSGAIYKYRKALDNVPVDEVIAGTLYQIATDGRYLYATVTSSTAVQFYPTQRQPIVWRRLDVTDGRRPFHCLAAPLGTPPFGS